MNALDRILLALSGDPVAEDTWSEACGLARAFGSELHLVRAVVAPEDTPGFGIEAKQTRAQVDDLQRRASEERVRIPSPPVVRSGHPFDVIQSVAREIEADLIVLGAGEKTTLGRIVLGSVAERISREAVQPVWLVRPGKSHQRIDSILCAVDNSDPAREALSAAIFLARAFVSRLTLLSVVSPDPESLDAERTKLLACLGAFDLHGVEARFQVRCGKPAVEIVKVAEEREVDLLVMGSAGRKGLARLLRKNTAEKVLRVVPCSLLTVQPS